MPGEQKDRIQQPAGPRHQLSTVGRNHHSTRNTDVLLPLQLVSILANLQTHSPRHQSALLGCTGVSPNRGHGPAPLGCDKRSGLYVHALHRGDRGLGAGQLLQSRLYLRASLGIVDIRLHRPGVHRQRLTQGSPGSNANGKPHIHTSREGYRGCPIATRVEHRTACDADEFPEHLSMGHGQYHGGHAPPPRSREGRPSSESNLAAGRPAAAFL